MDMNMPIDLGGLKKGPTHLYNQVLKRVAIIVFVMTNKIQVCGHDSITVNPKIGWFVVWFEFVKS